MGKRKENSYQRMVRWAQSVEKIAEALQSSGEALPLNVQDKVVASVVKYAQKEIKENESRLGIWLKNPKEYFWRKIQEMPRGVLFTYRDLIGEDFVWKNPSARNALESLFSDLKNTIPSLDECFFRLTEFQQYELLFLKPSLSAGIKSPKLSADGKRQKEAGNRVTDFWDIIANQILEKGYITDFDAIYPGKWIDPDSFIAFRQAQSKYTLSSRGIEAVAKSFGLPMGREKTEEMVPRVVYHPGILHKKTFKMKSQ